MRRSQLRRIGHLTRLMRLLVWPVSNRTTHPNLSPVMTWSPLALCRQLRKAGRIKNLWRVRLASYSPGIGSYVSVKLAPSKAIYGTPHGNSRRKS